MKKLLSIMVSVLCTVNFVSVRLHGMPPILSSNKIDVFINLCKNNANLDEVTRLIETNNTYARLPISLTTACKNGANRVALALIDAGADVNRTDPDNVCPFEYAVHTGMPDVLLKLIDKNVAIPAQTSFPGWQGLSFQDLADRQNRRYNTEATQLVKNIITELANPSVERPINHVRHRNEAVERERPIRPRNEAVEQARPAQPQPASESRMEQSSCTVCLSGFGEESDTGRNDANKLTVLTCGHTLHTKCYDELKNGSSPKKCPVCRKDLVKLTDLKP